MIAFVGSSMASTSEVTEGYTFLKDKTCDEKAIEYMDAIDSNNTMTPMEVYWAHRAYLAGCNGSVGTISE